jgi:hypothetical protein
VSTFRDAFPSSYPYPPCQVQHRASPDRLAPFIPEGLAAGDAERTRGGQHARGPRGAPEGSR